MIQNAFPEYESLQPGETLYPGMTLRDYFAGQKAERARIKSRVKEAAENLWCIRNQVGEEPYVLYIGPSLNMLEDFVEKLLEEN